MRRLLGLAWVASVSMSVGCAGGSAKPAPEAKAAPAPAASAPAAPAPAAPAPAASAPAASAPAAPAPKSEDAKFVADLQGLCTIATEVLADKSLAAHDKPRRIAERLKALAPGPEFQKVLGEMGALGQDERMPALRRAAAAHGLASFDCPALTAENR